MSVFGVDYGTIGGGGELFKEFSLTGANTQSDLIDTGLASISVLYLIWDADNSTNLYGANIYDVNKVSGKQFAGGSTNGSPQGYFCNIGDTTNNNSAAKIMSVDNGKFKVKNPNLAGTYNYKWYAE